MGRILKWLGFQTDWVTSSFVSERLKLDKVYVDKVLKKLYNNSEIAWTINRGGGFLYAPLRNTILTPLVGDEEDEEYE